MDGNGALASLGQSVTTGGIRTVNFFNGRLLSARDLKTEQDAAERAHRRLGRGVGDGIIYGFEVAEAQASTVQTPVVTVQPGMAVNRLGAVLELATAVDVSLVDIGSAAQGSGTAFSECDPGSPGGATATGLYLLTVSPASAGRGRAQVSGLGNESAACNTDVSEDGVTFSRTSLPVDADIVADTPRLRNRVAHLMFGTIDPRRWPEFDPMSFVPGPYGLLDDLRETCLDDSQVPLAVVFLPPGGGVDFVDRWSVRRRLIEPSPATPWPPLLEDRARAEAEAALLQFQEQVDDLAAGPKSLAFTKATEYFEFLPPVGMIPVGGTEGLRGFDADWFLTGQDSSEVATTNAELLRGLVQLSFEHRPIAPGTGERVQRYFIYDNLHAFEQGAAAGTVMVFAKASLPYVGIARFHFGHFGQSRFAPSVI